MGEEWGYQNAHGYTRTGQTSCGCNAEAGEPAQGHASCWYLILRRVRLCTERIWCWCTVFSGTLQECVWCAGHSWWVEHSPPSLCPLHHGGSECQLLVSSICPCTMSAGAATGAAVWCSTAHNRPSLRLAHQP
jgi:hypothetical protein